MGDTMPERRAPRRNWIGSFTRTSRIILFWYTLVTLTIRCPSSPSEVTDTSPWMCKPYFELREQVAPHVTPYYNTYAAPYVDSLVTPNVDKFITPYIDKIRPYAQKTHSMVYIPVRRRAMEIYQGYGAVQVSRVLEYCDSEWEKKAKPLVDRYLALAKEQYVLYVKPYISKIVDSVYPQMIRARRIAVKHYDDSIIPIYRKMSPYGQLFYNRSRIFIMNVGYPYSAWTVNKISGMVSRKIWPTIRLLYGQNVEPQLSKISERLGSYWDAKSLEAAVEAVDNQEESMSTLSTPSSVSTTYSTSLHRGTSTSTYTNPDTSTTATTGPVSQFTDVTETKGIINSILSKITASAEPTATPTVSELASETIERAAPIGSTTAEKVTEDLKRWQTKFKLAADKGADDLSERVSQITKRQVAGQVHSVGETLVLQLEDASKDAIIQLKAVMKKAVRDLPQDASEDDKTLSVENVWLAIRSAGKNLKEKAQELRSWKMRFDTNTDALVDAASRTTLNVIDSIRDLGLQEIGLRWASMDSVTYQDWAEYHNLKESFDEWREQVLNIASNHEGLLAAKQEADELEERGMAIAENAARELARLKDVASWKIHAQDSSDVFDSKGLPAAAARLGHKIMEKITGSAASASLESSVSPILSGVSDNVSAGQSIVTEAAKEAAQPTVDEGTVKAPSLDELVETGKESVFSALDATTTMPSVAEITSSFFQAMASITGGGTSRSIVSRGKGLTDSVASTIEDFTAEVSKSASSVYDEASISVPSRMYDMVQESSISPASSASSFASKAFEAVVDHIPSPTLTSSLLATITDFASSASSAVISPASSPSSMNLKDEMYAKVAALKEQLPVFSLDSSSSSFLSSSSSSSLPLADHTDAEEFVQRASTAVSSVTSVAPSVMSDVSATVAPSLSSSKQDVVDKAYAASSNLQSRFSEAGERYAEVTESLMSA